MLLLKKDVVSRLYQKLGIINRDVGNFRYNLKTVEQMLLLIAWFLSWASDDKEKRKAKMKNIEIELESS